MNALGIAMRELTAIEIDKISGGYASHSSKPVPPPPPPPKTNLPDDPAGKDY